jgi:hypothetical protein
MPHIYAQRPKYCIAFKPGTILVRRSSGEVESEYFGPEDRDARAAEEELLRREVDAAVQILAALHPDEPPANPPVAA